MSPVKRPGTAGQPSSFSTGKKSEGMALKLNPFLSPKSDLAHRIETGQLSNREELNSARSRGSPTRSPNYHRNSNSNLSPMNGSILKSPHSKGFHHKTASLISPDKSQSLLGGESVMTPKPELTETAIRRYEESKRMRDAKKRMGGEIFETVNQRKEIEHQVTALETRIKRLQMEERQMIKKINETASKTEKILEAKKRHQEELHNKYLQNKAREEYLEKRRQEINQQRNEVKSHLRDAIIGTYKTKHDIAYTVKQENNYIKMLKEQKEQETLEKNKERIKQLNAQHQDFLVKHNRKISGNDAKYYERLEEEKRKIYDLNDKYQELEKQEQALLQKLSATYNLHKAKIDQLEKVFSLKVSATEPVTLNTEELENGEYDDQE